MNNLPKGTMVNLISEKNDYGWVKIEYAGQTGWVSSIYLQETNSKADTCH